MGVLHGYHLLAPFPGTDVRENIRQYDLQIMSHDWRDYHANRAVVRTTAVSQEMMNDVVVDWEHQFNLWLDDIKQRRESGEASESEAWPLTNLEHTVLLYDLMMNHALEDKGVFRHNDAPVSDDAAIKMLVDRLAGTITQSQNQMVRTLAHALRRGYLSYTAGDGYCRWKWVDYL
jgi:anaerobic magnesium-protoporphyrin IX monomethyl ester cyclase